MTFAIVETTGPISGDPHKPLNGLEPAYWTQGGITIFFDTDDWMPEGDYVGAILPPVPGMVGITWRGDQLWVILKDGTPYKLCELHDSVARNVLSKTKSPNQRKIAQSIIEEAQNDGHECDLNSDDMLDYMGILGVQFERGTEASDEYIEGL